MPLDTEKLRKLFYQVDRTNDNERLAAITFIWRAVRDAGLPWSTFIDRHVMAQAAPDALIRAQATIQQLRAELAHEREQARRLRLELLQRKANAGPAQRHALTLSDRLVLDLLKKCTEHREELRPAEKSFIRGLLERFKAGLPIEASNINTLTLIVRRLLFHTPRPAKT